MQLPNLAFAVLIVLRGVFCICISDFFNLHVTELFGVKDVATFQALDILGVFVPGNDSNPGVSAGGCHRSWEWVGISTLSARL